MLDFRLVKCHSGFFCSKYSNEEAGVQAVASCPIVNYFQRSIFNT